MRNLKHTMSAFLAVVMVSSLATTQVKNMSSAFASKDIDENIVLELIEGGVSVETAQIEDVQSEKVQETVEEKIDSLDKVDLAKPFEPKTGYVIATSGTLNVRAARDINSNIIGKLNPGVELWLEGEFEDWYLISYEVDGSMERGYVSKEFIVTSYEEAKGILLEDVMYEKAKIMAGAEMKSAPDMNASAMEGFLEEKDVIIIKKVDENWSHIYVADDYTAGYVLNSALTLENKLVTKEQVFEDRMKAIKAIATAGYVYADGSVNVRTMPGEDKEIKITLPSGTSCYLVETIGDWVKISYGEDYTAGYVKKEYTITKDKYDAIKAEERRQQQARAAKTKKSSYSYSMPANYTTPASSSKGQQIVNAASKYIGVRYVYGGTSPSGFDCSGLVQYACRQVGISVNRTSRDQYKNGVAVAKSDLQPGDLVFFSKGSTISHVGIYAGNGQVLHSPSPGKSVCYTSLSSMCSYSKYVGARRVY